MTHLGTLHNWHKRFGYTNWLEFLDFITVL